jgi:hypothetical protein
VDALDGEAARDVGTDDEDVACACSAQRFAVRGAVNARNFFQKPFGLRW